MTLPKRAPVAIFCHSIVSDWNHGNAHFLRGIVAELRARGHEVRVFEPADGWSRANLVADCGPGALARFERDFPGLRSARYELATLDLDAALDGVGLVLVHEWNTPELVSRIGEHRARARSYRLLFHDTHHRSVTAPHEMEAFDLRHFDAALVFGEALRAVYLARGWSARVFTWHEAADVRRFRPLPADPALPGGDIVFVGNWGDDERGAELREFLLEPVRRLEVEANVFGVRYPARAQQALAWSRVRYRGFLPNADVPGVFARHRATVHVPRRPYAHALPGIPTIRVFEALACGLPLVCAPWSDDEGLFRPGADYLVARDGAEMRRLLRLVLADRSTARELAASGLERIRARHTCAHRVEELMRIVAALDAGPTPAVAHDLAPAAVPLPRCQDAVPVARRRSAS